MRSEGNQILQALDELIHIAREGKCAAEIYHLKAAGAANWPKLEQVISKVEAARSEDWELCAQTAHSFVSTCGTVGAMRFARLLREIESACRRGESTAVDALVERARGECESTIDAVLAL